MMEKRDIPRHIAIIMDGNRTWAQAQHLPTIEGHRRGAHTVKKIVKACGERGIPYLTLYAFSTENWKRSKEEVNALMGMLEEFLKNEEQEFLRNKIRLLSIGKIEELPASVVTQIHKVEASTQKDFQYTLVLALNYGARMEIVDACKKMVDSVVQGHIKKEHITQEMFSGCLYTAQIPDPDMVIRTSGQIRLSNFLLWQSSYAELYFTDKVWPAFTEEDLDKALAEYQKRKRKFGG